MPHSSPLYEITSLITRAGMSGKVVVESLVSISPETITITMRDPRGTDHVTIRVAREMIPELPEAFERVCRGTG